MQAGNLPGSLLLEFQKQSGKAPLYFLIPFIVSGSCYLLPCMRHLSNWRIQDSSNSSSVYLILSRPLCTLGIIFILFVWWEAWIHCSYPLPHTIVNSDNLNASNVNYLKSTHVLSIYNFPGGIVVKNLPINVGDKKVRYHSWVGKISWRRKWQPIPAFLLGQSHGQGSLVGYSPRSCKESDMIDQACTFSI